MLHRLLLTLIIAICISLGGASVQAFDDKDLQWKKYAVERMAKENIPPPVPSMPVILPPVLGAPIGNDNDGSTRCGVNFGSYMADLQARIRSNWKIYPYRKRTEVLFKIHSDGSVSDLKIGQSTGSELENTEALKTITRSAPFPRLPSGSPSLVDIAFTFDQNLRSRSPLYSITKRKQIDELRGEAQEFLRDGNKFRLVGSNNLAEEQSKNVFLESRRKAEESFKRALAICEELYGAAYQPRTVETLVDLADVYKELGKKEEEKQVLCKAEVLVEKKQKKDNDDQEQLLLLRSRIDGIKIVEDNQAKCQPKPNQ